MSEVNALTSPTESFKWCSAYLLWESHLFDDSPFTSCSVALSSGLSRPRHPGWDVIARAVFAFLFLEDRIIHMDVVEYRGQILMPQELLERKGIVALNEVVHGKRVSKDMRTDALSCDPRAFFESLEEH